MHLKVILRPDGHVRLDGWFNVPETNGLLDATSDSCAQKTVTFQLDFGTEILEIVRYEMLTLCSNDRFLTRCTYVLINVNN